MTFILQFFTYACATIFTLSIIISSLFQSDQFEIIPFALLYYFIFHVFFFSSKLLIISNRNVIKYQPMLGLSREVIIGILYIFSLIPLIGWALYIPLRGIYALTESFIEVPTNINEKRKYNRAKQLSDRISLKTNELSKLKAEIRAKELEIDSLSSKAIQTKEQVNKYHKEAGYWKKILELDNDSKEAIKYFFKDSKKINFLLGVVTGIVSSVLSKFIPIEQLINLVKQLTG